jgi:hypothetical protein
VVLSFAKIPNRKHQFSRKPRGRERSNQRIRCRPPESDLLVRCDNVECADAAWKHRAAHARQTGACRLDQPAPPVIGPPSGFHVGPGRRVFRRSVYSEQLFLERTNSVVVGFLSLHLRRVFGTCDIRPVRLHRLSIRHAPVRLTTPSACAEMKEAANMRRPNPAEGCH